LITRVASGAALALAMAAPTTEARAQYRSGVTDSDPNDSSGHGRGRR